VTKRVLNAPDWLIAQPIAHRGLHSRASGIIENTLAAAKAAIAQRYSIECDIQITRDGEAVVFHDFMLDRLTKAKGRLDTFNADELSQLSYQEGDQNILTLAAFLTAIDARTGVIIEIKSRYDGDLRLADRALQIVNAYPGPVSLKSFDPEVLVHLRGNKAACPLGLVAQAKYQDEEFANLSRAQRQSFSALSHFPHAQPDFLSWNLDDLPHAIPMLCRAGIGMPVMVWTVRSKAEADFARCHADQIIFEGFTP